MCTLHREWSSGNSRTIPVETAPEFLTGFRLKRFTEISRTKFRTVTLGTGSVELSETLICSTDCVCVSSFPILLGTVNCTAAPGARPGVDEHVVGHGFVRHVYAITGRPPDGTEARRPDIRQGFNEPRRLLDLPPSESFSIINLRREITPTASQIPGTAPGIPGGPFHHRQGGN